MIGLFIIPMITMRLFAEEKRTGTIELLITSPVTDLAIIMGKWLAAEKDKKSPRPVGMTGLGSRLRSRLVGLAAHARAIPARRAVVAMRMMVQAREHAKTVRAARAQRQIAGDQGRAHHCGCPFFPSFAQAP